MVAVGRAVGVVALCTKSRPEGRAVNFLVFSHLAEARQGEEEGGYSRIERQENRAGTAANCS